MEQKNSQELNRKTFSDLIYDPSAINADDSRTLKSLVETYPYSQLIRSFYTRSLVNENAVNSGKELIKSALFFPDRSILRAIIEDPGSFQSTQISSPVYAEASNMGEEELITESESTAGADYSDTVENQSPQTDSEDLQEAEPEKTQRGSLHSQEELPPQDQDEGSAVEVQRMTEIENIPISNPDRTADDLPDIEEDQLGEQTQEVSRGELAADDISGADLSATESIPESEPEEDELDLLIKQNIVPADFLKDEAITDQPVHPAAEITGPEVDLAENIPQDVNVKAHQKVSRYDDDKMPYSFLWWLSKTRKEHTENYQPYVSFQLDTTQSIKRNAVDPISSQIIENIFHLQSPVDQFENAPRTVPFQVKRKEDYILEKFIREEPQIKPPNSEKLDTENKARKSAEDPNDLVSETLAQIYTDQMLFHKAIDTYKKLSLKFPEKSTYFADQIRELEKKIN